MDLRQLEMAIAVADNASFTRAGEQLHVAQSAISRKIRLLEDELGEPLFQRVNKRVILTPAGATLLRYGRRIFQDLRNAALEVSEFAHLERGHVKIGAGMIACTYILPPILERFKRLHPRIEIEVVTDATNVLLAKLLDNSIEVGLFTLPVQHPDLEVIPLCTEEMGVVVSTKHVTLAKRRWIKVQEIEGCPLITFQRETNTRAVLEEFFHRARINPRIAMESGNVATIKPLVKIDLGISILPWRAVAEEVKRKELHYLRIRNFRLTRQVGLVYKKVSDPPKILLELIRLFKETQERSAG